MAFRPHRTLATWRRVALSAWGAPRNPTAYGTLDVDCEAALLYLARLREHSGERVTLTHLVGKAVAVAIAAHPDVNGFASHGRLMLRDSIDVFFQVAFFDEDKPKDAEQPKGGKKRANLAGAKIEHADKKSVVEIARELRERASAIRR